jgi:hypothetical protein
MLLSPVAVLRFLSTLDPAPRRQAAVFDVGNADKIALHAR